MDGESLRCNALSHSARFVVSDVGATYLGRCESDVPFFFEHELQIRPKELVEGGIVPFVLNVPQTHVEGARGALQEKGEKQRILILKARQWGSSSLCQGYAMWKSRFRPYSDTLVIGDRDKTTKALMRMNRRMHDNLSPLVKKGWERTISNTDSFYEWNNGSVLEIATAGSPQAARGTTRSYLHASEVAFWPNGDSLVQALMPAVKAAELVIFESTSNGDAGIFWELWQSAEDRWSDWTRIFIPWTMHTEYTEPLDEDLAAIGRRAAVGDPDALDEISWLDETERAWLLTGELTLGQTVWRRKTIATDFRGEEEDFEREYPRTAEEAFRAPKGGYLHHEARKAQEEAVVTAYTRMSIPVVEGAWVMLDEDVRPAPEAAEDGWIDVLEDPEEGVVYVMGVDPSEGVEQDDAAFVIRKAGGPVVCAGARNDMATDLFAEALWSVGRKYNWATCNVERAGGGLAVINHLIRLAYPTLYPAEPLDATGPPADPMSVKYGFTPSVEPVKSLLAMFRHSCNTLSVMLRHPRLVKQTGKIRIKVKESSDGTVTSKWHCPGKGRVLPTGERVSDDLFRAAALTEPPARDNAWIKTIAAEYATQEETAHRAQAPIEDLDYHNPLLDPPKEDLRVIERGEGGVVRDMYQWTPPRTIDDTPYLDVP